MERNYKDDQAVEIEALESIYYNDFEVVEFEPLHVFKIAIHTEEYDTEQEENGIACKLVFAYTAKYPDTPPNVEIEDPVNFDDDYEANLVEHINETIQENLGMEMIFSVVSSAQEWLNVKWDEQKQVKENALFQKLQEYEEAERKKFEGTRVSVETFLAWRNIFEHDLGIDQRREKALAENRKLTGRELFMRDTTLIDSDIKFLLEAGDSIENVKIDEALFENLELDSSDDEDDEDYVPGQ